MYIEMPILVGIAGAFLFLLVLVLRRAKQDRRDDLLRAPPASALTAALSPNDEREVRAMLLQGHKIEAIRYLRETAGIGLKEAKELAERIDAGA